MSQESKVALVLAAVSKVAREPRDDADLSLVPGKLAEFLRTRQLVPTADDVGSEEQMREWLNHAIDEEIVAGWADGALSALWAAILRREACLAMAGPSIMRVVHVVKIRILEAPRGERCLVRTRHVDDGPDPVRACADCPCSSFQRRGRSAPRPRRRRDRPRLTASFQRRGRSAPRPRWRRDRDRPRIAGTNMARRDAARATAHGRVRRTRGAAVELRAGARATSRARSVGPPDGGGAPRAPVFGRDGSRAGLAAPVPGDADARGLPLL